MVCLLDILVSLVGLNLKSVSATHNCLVHVGIQHCEYEKTKTTGRPTNLKLEQRKILVQTPLLRMQTHRTESSSVDAHVGSFLCICTCHALFVVTDEFYL